MKSSGESCSTIPPNFLCIGVPKGGSTWLYELLNSHPEVWVPPQKREVHFFDRESNLQRGVHWYGKFFPDRTKGQQYNAIGEVTPHYLYLSDDRIAYVGRNFPSIRKVLFILRDPVERAYSHFWFRKRIEGYDKSFEEFVETRPQSIEWGFYAKYVANWLRYFSRSQMLALILEQAVANVPKTKETLAEFLCVDAERFPNEVGERHINERAMPRFPVAYMMACKAMQRLHAMDMYWLANTVKRIGAKKLFENRDSETSKTPMKPATRDHLEQVYKRDIAHLEHLLQVDLSIWTSGTLPGHGAAGLQSFASGQTENTPCP